jgi:hypothetical protein
MKPGGQLLRRFQIPDALLPIVVVVIVSLFGLYMISSTVLEKVNAENIRDINVFLKGIAPVMAGSVVALVLVLLFRAIFRYLSEPSRFPPIARDLADTIIEVEMQLSRLTSDSQQVGLVESEEIKAAAVSRITESVTRELSREWEEKYRKEAIADAHVARIRDTASAMQQRLRDEIEALSRRSLVNLLIGIAVTILGVIALL